MSGQDDFWSRRKAAVRAEAKSEDLRHEDEARAAEQEKLEAKSDEELLKELDLPDPDTLGEGDDFTPFMSRAVPDRLRRRALKRLWLSNPALANVDGLIEYGEDYTDAATVVDGLVSAYQVGKGMLAHIEEMARQEEEVPEVEAEKAEVESDTLELLEVEQAHQSEEKSPEYVDLATEESLPDDGGAPIIMASRRMRFTFEPEESA